MTQKGIWIATLVAIPLVLTACAGQNTSPGVASAGEGTAAPTSSGDPAKYAACLREHGLTVTQDNDSLIVRGPDPQTGAAAEQACKQYAPVVAGMTAEEKKKAMDQALKFTACMRQKGVNMPDPQQDEKGGIKLDPPQGIDQDAPAVQEAQKACRPLMDQSSR
ncbi:hypothetical protein [Nonomuraea sediminis]|uniref:hypothetical protein n=1 Tax=Nonomuraea sediminis TaxID=2835864 RepID=UPI001BDCFABF|nr:hypothetical protein [Nonomuraea sediminis]